jgi:hypothetical protein
VQVARERNWTRNNIVSRRKNWPTNPRIFNALWIGKSDFLKPGIRSVLHSVGPLSHGSHSSVELASMHMRQKRLVLPFSFWIGVGEV